MEEANNVSTLLDFFCRFLGSRDKLRQISIDWLWDIAVGDAMFWVLEEANWDTSYALFWAATGSGQLVASDCQPVKKNGRMAN